MNRNEYIFAHGAGLFRRETKTETSSHMTLRRATIREFIFYKLSWKWYRIRLTFRRST